MFITTDLPTSIKEEIQKCFEAYVRENDFNGKTWLQILEISRYGNMPETFIQEAEEKVNEVYMMDQLSLKTLDQIKGNLSFT